MATPKLEVNAYPDNSFARIVGLRVPLSGVTGQVKSTEYGSYYKMVEFETCNPRTGEAVTIKVRADWLEPIVGDKAIALQEHLEAFQAGQTLLSPFLPLNELICSYGLLLYLAAFDLRKVLTLSDFTPMARLIASLAALEPTPLLMLVASQDLPPTHPEGKIERKLRLLPPLRLPQEALEVSSSPEFRAEPEVGAEALSLSKNSELRTPNSELRTPNSELRTKEDEETEYLSSEDEQECDRVVEHLVNIHQAVSEFLWQLKYQIFGHDKRRSRKYGTFKELCYNLHQDGVLPAPSTCEEKAWAHEERLIVERMELSIPPVRLSDSALLGVRKERDMDKKRELLEAAYHDYGTPGKVTRADVEEALAHLRPDEGGSKVAKSKARKPSGGSSEKTTIEELTELQERAADLFKRLRQQELQMQTMQEQLQIVETQKNAAEAALAQVVQEREQLAAENRLLKMQLQVRGAHEAVARL